MTRIGMKGLIGATALLLASTSLASAGGIERNAFTTGILFEDGNYVELGYSWVNPSVSGSVTGAPVSSGDMASSFDFTTFSYANELTDKLTFVFVVDEPVGANTTYPDGGAYPFEGSFANVSSTQVTAALRYEFQENMSVFGGLRLARAEGDVYVDTPAFSYRLQDAESDHGLGFMIGAAYEIPEIAMRVALTYFSEIDLDFTGPEGVGAFDTAPGAIALGAPGNFGVTLPDSILLEAQTGVAEGTLVFGSVRWVDWSEFDITPNIYPAGSLVDYDDDTFTYIIGGARVLNDNWTVLGSLTHEPATGGFVGNLGPTDGRTAIGLGARYTQGPVVIQGGIQYIWIGEANTILNPVGPVTSTFDGNTAVSAGVRVGYRF